MNSTVHANAIRLPEPLSTDLKTGLMDDDARIERANKTVGQMEYVFLDEFRRREMDAAKLVYAVEVWKPVAEGTEGGLYWGNSTVFPGMVGEEYFMTRGHYHARNDRAEFYTTVSGRGLLVLMDEHRHASVQEMGAGTTHYIPGRVAHRVVNTTEVPLTFLACWPSDAGHDYQSIAQQGFSVRVMRRNGRPEVVAQS